MMLAARVMELLAKAAPPTMLQMEVGGLSTLHMLLRKCSRRSSTRSGSSESSQCGTTNSQRSTNTKSTASSAGGTAVSATTSSTSCVACKTLDDSLASSLEMPLLHNAR